MSKCPFGNISHCDSDCSLYIKEKGVCSITQIAISLEQLKNIETDMNKIEYSLGEIRKHYLIN